jgi:hypothetical protein
LDRESNKRAAAADSDGDGGDARRVAPGLRRRSGARRRPGTGTALGAIFACLLAGFAAAPCAALVPHWGRCQPVAPGDAGRYSDAGCTVQAPNHGSYDWVPLQSGQHVAIGLLPLGGSLRFETRAGTKIECSAVGTEGQLQPHGPTGALTPLWELEGCESEGQECHTFGAALVGEVSDLFQWLEKPVALLSPAPGWRGRLGVIANTPLSVGIQYTAKNHERLFDPIVCDGPLGLVSIGNGGSPSFISRLTPVNAMTSEFTETYAESEPGVPVPAQFEHHRPAVAMGFVSGHLEQIAIVATLTYRMEAGAGELEVRASR